MTEWEWNLSSPGHSKGSVNPNPSWAQGWSWLGECGDGEWEQGHQHCCEMRHLCPRTLVLRSLCSALPEG